MNTNSNEMLINNRSKLRVRKYISAPVQCLKRYIIDKGEFVYSKIIREQTLMHYSENRLPLLHIFSFFRNQ